MRRSAVLACTVHYLVGMLPRGDIFPKRTLSLVGDTLLVFQPDRFLVGGFSRHRSSGKKCVAKLKNRNGAGADQIVDDFMKYGVEGMLTMMVML